MGQHRRRQEGVERQPRSTEQAPGLLSSGTTICPHTGSGAESCEGWSMQDTAQPWRAEGRPSQPEAMRSLQASSSAQAKDCKRCKRNSGLGPWSKRMDPTPTSTNPSSDVRIERPETPLFSCTFSCKQEKRVLDIAENPCYH
jgi:hypothetical protein